MTTAIWIIAIVEVIRALQNGIQMFMVYNANNNKEFKRATDEFVKSLNKTDAEFVEDMLKKFEEKK